MILLINQSPCIMRKLTNSMLKTGFLRPAPLFSLSYIPKNYFTINNSLKPSPTFKTSSFLYPFAVSLIIGSYWLYSKSYTSNGQPRSSSNKSTMTDFAKQDTFNQTKYDFFRKREIRNFYEKALFAFTHLLRFLQLLFIFAPTLAFLPLRLFDKTRQFWIDTFVKAVQRAGVVWIKSFQYLSHRRDIIGVEISQKFSHLREHAPEHSFEQTESNFKQVYVKQINEVFDEFEKEPIASGSVSQVYRAKYHGKKVAVKVRHPKVEKHITRDINLLFFFSRVLSIFSKTFSLPVTEDSMKRTLNEQINFINQKENLIIFNEQFKNRHDITFPKPYEKDSNQNFLIEQFVEGVPITYYEEQEHQLRPVIARLGAETFFDMLIKHNFIHADAHGGNIMVEIKEKSVTFFGQIWEYIRQQLIWIESEYIGKAIQSELLKKLFKEGADEAAKIRKIVREANQKVTLKIIDAGMVISLSEADQKNFIYFIKNVIEGNGQECAKLIYRLSNYDNVKIKDQQFPKYSEDLYHLFEVINDKDLENLPGLTLFTSLLDIIRDNGMKLDGEFATLLTNMLVLEGLAKDIWPDINILKIALPYMNHLDRKIIEHPEPKVLD